MPPEAIPTGAVGLHVMLQHGGIALAQSIDIYNGAKIIEFVMPRDIGSFPHRALHRFPISHEHVGAIVLLVDEFCIESESDTDGEALAQGTGRHVDEG